MQARTHVDKKCQWPRLGARTCVYGAVRVIGAPQLHLGRLHVRPALVCVQHLVGEEQADHGAGRCAHWGAALRTPPCSRRLGHMWGLDLNPDPYPCTHALGCCSPRAATPPLPGAPPMGTCAIQSIIPITYPCAHWGAALRAPPCCRRLWEPPTDKGFQTLIPNLYSAANTPTSCCHC